MLMSKIIVFNLCMKAGRDDGTNKKQDEKQGQFSVALHTPEQDDLRTPEQDDFSNIKEHNVPKLKLYRARIGDPVHLSGIRILLGRGRNLPDKVL